MTADAPTTPKVTWRADASRISLCGCGCGSPAPIARKTDARDGHIKGQPIRFINTHNNRLLIADRPCASCGRQLTQVANRRCLMCENADRRARGLATFWSRVDQSAGLGACWPWTGFIADNGYGKTSRGWRRQACAHHIAYESAVGPVEKGYELDHVCHSIDLTCAGGPSCLHRRCCNPVHLEPVQHIVNVRRGRWVTKAVA